MLPTQTATNSDSYPPDPPPLALTEGPSHAGAHQYAPAGQPQQMMYSSGAGPSQQMGPAHGIVPQAATMMQPTYFAPAQGPYVQQGHRRG